MKSEGNKKTQNDASPTNGAEATSIDANPALSHTNTTTAPADKTNPANISSVALDNAAGADVKYTSSDIGVKTTVKVDPFAKHKERQQAERKERHKIYLIVGIVGAIIIIALIIWLILALNNNGSNSNTPADDSSLSEGNAENYEDNPYPEALSETTGKVYEDALKAYEDNDNNFEAAATVFNDAITAAQNKTEQDSKAVLSEVSQIQLSQISFYFDEEKYEEIIKVKDEINVDGLNNAQKALLYDLVYLAYNELGDYQQASYYSDLAGEYTYLELQEKGETELEAEL